MIPIYIIIPILNEHKHITACATYFAQRLNEHTHLVFVFSTKEICHRKEIIARIKNRDKSISCLYNYLTTSTVDSLIQQYGDIRGVDLTSALKYAPYTWELAEFNAKIAACPHISCCFDTDQTACMAGQINYGILWVAKKNPNANILIYNVDSRPDFNSLKRFRQVMAAHTDTPLVIQQYSLYNLEHPVNTFRKSSKLESIILDQARNWQNRWALTFELPRILIARKMIHLTKNLKPRWLKVMIQSIAPFNYCIGHGLLINHHALDKLDHQIPDTFWNEDAYLGYKLACRKDIPMFTVETFDIAEMTSKLQVYIQQQAVWFNGPLQAFSYWRHGKDRSLGSFYAAFKLFRHAIYWLTGPLVWMTGFISGVFIGFWKSFDFYTVAALFYWFGVSLLYGPLINLLTQRLLMQLKQVGVNIQHPKKTDLFSFYIFYCCHMLGPLTNIGQKLIYEVKKRFNPYIPEPTKYKTERN